MDAQMITALEIAAGVAIPSIAILVSTSLAVWIASSERKAATAAREDERRQIAQDRRDDRSQEAFVRTLIALSTLNTLNIAHEPLAGPLREFRVGLSLLVAAADADSDAVGEWLEIERLRGASRAGESLARLESLGYVDMSYVSTEDVIWASEPLNVWAGEFASRLRVWRRGRTTEDEITELAAAVRAELHTASE